MATVCWSGQAPREEQRMTDREAERVREAVEAYLGGRPGFDIGHETHVSEMVSWVGDNVRLKGVSPVDLHVVASMCLLAVKHAPRRVLGAPPKPMRDHLLGLLESHVRGTPKRVGRAYEFAAAYGCGRWWGSTEEDGWRSPWGAPGLERALMPAVIESNLFLAKRAIPYRELRGLDNPTGPNYRSNWAHRLRGDTDVLAKRLIG